jgi:competence protein ComGC
MNKGNAVRQQRGLSLIGLLFVGLIVVFLLLIGFKVVPAVTEYIAIEKAIRKVNKEGTTVAQIRREFENYVITDDIKSISGKDLDITKENDRVVVSYAYSYSIPIMDNVRLVIDFSGSTRTRSKSTS